MLSIRSWRVKHDSLVIRQGCNCIVYSGRVGGQGILLDYSSPEVAIHACLGDYRGANIYTGRNQNVHHDLEKTLHTGKIVIARLWGEVGPTDRLLTSDRDDTRVCGSFVRDAQCIKVIDGETRTRVGHE